jgi:hypothetical protein
MNHPLASVGQVIAALRGVLDLVGGARQWVTAARVTWDPAASRYQATVTGSGQPEATDLSSLCDLAHRQISETEELIARCEAAVQTIIDRLAGGSPMATSTRGPGGELRLPTHRRHAAVVRRELRRIGRTGYGVKTRGAWINNDGTTDRSSAAQILRGTGEPGPCWQGWDGGTPRWTPIAKHKPWSGCSMKAVSTRQSC